MKKFYKVLYGKTSYGSQEPYEHKTDTMLTHPDFDEDAAHDYGGFFVADKRVILRFITWGTTLYEALVPDDAVIVDIPNEMFGRGEYKVSKMMLCKPVQLTDDLVLDLMKETDVPMALWFDIISLCALHGFKRSALEIIRLFVNGSNIEEAIKRYTKYYSYRHGFMFGHIQADVECADEIYHLLVNQRYGILKRTESEGELYGNF